MTAFFAGFDSYIYPGDDKMRSLWDHTNLYWCGFYLGPNYNWTGNFGTIKKIGWGVAPLYMGKNPNSAKLLKIHNQHLGKPAAMKTALYENGRGDGVEATQWARTAGIPQPTIIYFDVEKQNHNHDWVTYYRGWCRAVVESGYSPGIYGGPGIIDWLQSRLLKEAGLDICLPYVWAAKYTEFPPDPKVKTYDKNHILKAPFPEPDPKKAMRGATSWQHRGNCMLTWVEKDGLGNVKTRAFAPADLNSSIFRDPGLGILGEIAIAA